MYTKNVSLDKKAVKGNTIKTDEKSDIEYVELSLSTEKEVEKSLLVQGSLLNGITNNTGKIVFEIWSDCEKDIPLKLYCKSTADDISEFILTVSLKKGKNKIIFTVPSGVWNNGGKLDYT